MVNEEIASRVPQSTEAEKDCVVGVPDQANQILLMQFARARGLRAYVPGRSEKRVVLRASEAEVRRIVKECGALSMVLEIRRLKVLREVLEEHGLQVPEELDSALARL
ncbi:MAG: hypothetical protein Q8Q12_19000 [bacterium]|nr:hypothetical protein [bacterium]